jgi:hypothetical protein
VFGRDCSTSTGLRNPTFLGILLDPPQEIITTSRVSDMLNTDMQPLFNVPIANDLVDHDADRALGDVEDDAGLAVIEFVG